MLVAVSLLPLIYISNLAAAYSDSAYYEIGSVRPEDNPNELRLWLTISAQHHFIEISWKNAPVHSDDNILLTRHDPESFSKLRLIKETPLAPYDNEGSGSGSGIDSGNGNGNGNFLPATDSHAMRIGLDDDMGSGWEPTPTHTHVLKSDKPAVQFDAAKQSGEYWMSSNGPNDIVAALKPRASTQWFTTGVYFDFALSRNVTTNTTCYGYWASYIDGMGKILAKNCIRAYPRWMRDLHPIVGNLRIRDLFLPGTHDSGSYRANFDPLIQETLVTKYALTQDDDIRGQLMHGARYLDIRVGYYRNTPELFYINHGITRQVPLADVIQQVKDFVLETNEIVVFGLKEFPVGFKRNLGEHRLLVSFLQEKFGDLIVHPSATWSSLVGAIWSRQQNVILAYDIPAIVNEFPQVLFGSVEQRWGNVQKWAPLEKHLRNVNNFYISRLSSRPVADMAELTPDTWGVVLDKYGGLRKMADNVNWRVSQLYRDEIGHLANIVAVDFIRGTSLMDIAIDYNKRKVIY